VIISVGRLFRQKRFDLLLEAFALLTPSYEVELWICGEGPERKSLERLIRRSNLESSAHLLGFCPNPYALMRQASVFALSSDYEGLPNALIEAQGLGLPAVSTDCPFGPDEIIEHGVTGFLTEPGDHQALADALARVLNDEHACKTMARQARDRTRSRFGLPLLTGEWTAHIESACRNHAGARPPARRD
jgi:glycosyltransferase involved in cell wall biosynthesis